MAHIRLIVGLGNPGAKYAETRHNAGVWMVENLANHHHQTLRLEQKFYGFVGEITVTEAKCHLLIPTTFMNDSGRAVSSLAKFFKIRPAEILVAHDELDFPAGKVRLKQAGGHGGHNGLRDIVSHLGSNDFYRLRIGIGHPGHKDKVTPYVLGRPSISDKRLIVESIDRAMAVFSEITNGDFEKAMRCLH